MSIILKITANCSVLNTGNNYASEAWVSSQITSQNAQSRVPLSPCKKPGPVSALIYIAVGHPQQTLLWWKIATARSFILNRDIATADKGPQSKIKRP